MNVTKLKSLALNSLLVLLISMVIHASDDAANLQGKENIRKRLHRACELSHPYATPDYTEEAREGRIGLLPATASKRAILTAILNRLPFKDDYTYYSKLKDMIGQPPVPYDYRMVPHVTDIIGHFPTIDEYAEYVCMKELLNRSPIAAEIDAALESNRSYADARLHLSTASQKTHKKR